MSKRVFSLHGGHLHDYSDSYCQCKRLCRHGGDTEKHIEEEITETKPEDLATDTG